METLRLPVVENNDSIRCVNFEKCSLIVLNFENEEYDHHNPDHNNTLMNKLNQTIIDCTNLEKLEDVAIYSTVDTDLINSADSTELLRIIISFYLQDKRCGVKNFNFSFCNLSGLLETTFFNNLNSLAADSSDFSFESDSILVLDNNNDRDAISKRSDAITNCSFFKSWHLHLVDPDYLVNDKTILYYESNLFILNALTKNKYIQSLAIDVGGDNACDAIANLVNNTTTLTKLSLTGERRWGDVNSVSTNAASNLVEALINSKTITDLSLSGFLYKDDTDTKYESYHIMRSALQKLANIQKLELDSTLLAWDSGRYHFDASIFTNVFKKLQELNILLPATKPDEEQKWQQVLQFFLLLQNSFLEKLTFSGNTYHIKELVNVIPFMSRLRFFHIHCIPGSFHKFHSVVIKSIAICSHTLSEVNVTEIEKLESGELTRRHVMTVTSVDSKYLERNSKILKCIENKIHCSEFPKNALPKFLSVAKPTGPDAAYKFLNNLSHSVGHK